MWFTLSVLLVLLSYIQDYDRLVTAEETTNPVIGTWVQRDFCYVFDNAGNMKAFKLKDEPKGYMMFKYSLVHTENHDFIKYGKKLIDRAHLELLLVKDVTDSTVLFSVGTPFVRTDSSTTLRGRWKHVKDFKTILLDVGVKTIDYHEMLYDVNSATTIIQEERHGHYTTGKGNESGLFFISFNDGTETEIHPILFGDIMYLFDLSSRKCMFYRTETAPFYQGLQERNDQKKVKAEDIRIK